MERSWERDAAAKTGTVAFCATARAGDHAENRGIPRASFGILIARAVAMSSPRPRRWSVVVHRHEDASFTARVWVDGKLLRPDCVGCSAAAALCYVADALVDAYPDDQLTLRTQGGGVVEASRAVDAPGAIAWLATRLEAMQPAAFPEGAQSGTSAIVRDASFRSGDSRVS